VNFQQSNFGDISHITSRETKAEKITLSLLHLKFWNITFVIFLTFVSAPVTVLSLKHHLNLFRVLTSLENLEDLEMSGNFVILENSGKSQGI